MNGFEIQKQRTAEAAEKEFESCNPRPSEPSDLSELKAWQRRRGEHVRGALNYWFSTIDPADAICYTESTDHLEIRDAWFGGTITVYRPRLGYKYEKDEIQKVVQPGYLSGSSWDCGRSGTPAATMIVMMANFLLMQKLAIQTLNHYNAVVLDWPVMDNPMARLERLEIELKSYKEAEAARAAKKASRKGGR